MKLLIDNRQLIKYIGEVADYGIWDEPDVEKWKVDYGYIIASSYTCISIELVPTEIIPDKYFYIDGHFTLNTNFKDSNTEIVELQLIINELKAKINNTIDIETCTLEELKAYKIKQSKLNLENYLKSHFLTSSCHGGIKKQYSITEEKQTLLNKEIMLATGSDTYKPSWNASGESCTYDWTLTELMMLAYEMSAIVKPLVSLQQNMEININAAETKEEVLAINITFE